MAALLVAEIVSSLGSLMSVVALPWFVLQTTGSPSRMAAVLAAEAAPLALLGVPSGRVAGALGARRTLLACDLVWAPAVAAIPLLHFAGALSFPLLLTLAFAAGLPWAAHYGSQAAVLPELHGEEPAAIGRARALLQTAGRLTYFAGPVLGGLLLAAIGAPAVLLVDAGTFVVSFALVAAFVPATPPAVADPRGGGGLRVLARDPVLRRLTIGQLLSQAAFMAMTAAVPVLVFTAYGRDARLAGLLLAAWGAGAVLGGLAAYRLVERHEPLSLGAAAWALQALPLWAMAGSPRPALAAGALALSGVGNGIRVPPVAAAITARISPAMRAETLTVSTSVVGTGGLVALLAAGPALQHLGVGTVFTAVAAAQTAAAAIAFRVARAAAARQPQIAPMPRSVARAQNAGRGVRFERITP
jgi:predicted MFS family arabinose efflux permease